ncbi:MAG: hypothetical protein K5864_05560 [Bacteroidales bacterium]|nr:hypothetical protein [Bacteroidales bacterium]
MKRLLFILPVLFMLSSRAVAQEDTIVSLTADRPIHLLQDPSKLLDTVEPWEFHLSMGAALVGSSFSTASLWSVTPTVVYRPNDRLKIKASATAFESWSLSPHGYRLGVRDERDLAPWRPGVSHVGMQADLSVSYQVNDRLWLAASLHHWGGSVASAAVLSPWYFSDAPMELDATAFSAHMRYRIGDDNYLSLHMMYLEDRTGAMLPMMLGYPYGGFGQYGSATFGSHLFYNPF